MPDEMFFFGNGRGLKRGRRRDKRTPTCRPCIIWPMELPDMQTQGVVLDANMHGMLVRMLDAFPPGTLITVQMMLDDSFVTPLADAFKGEVVRSFERDGFVDHGVLLHHEYYKRPEHRRLPSIRVTRPTSAQAARKVRMQSLDLRTNGTPRIR